MQTTPEKVSANSCKSDCPHAVPTESTRAIVVMPDESAKAIAVMTAVMTNVAAKIFTLAMRV